MAKFTRRWPLLLGALYVVALFAYTATWTRQPWSFNSDDLYCASFCEDLLQGRDLQGWHFTAAPFVFPDLTLMLPSQALFSNLLVALLAYDFLLYTLLLTALAWIARSIGFSRREAFLTACTGLLFLFATHLDRAYYPRASEMYQPGYHVGAVLSGVLLTALVLHALRFGLGKANIAALLLLCPLAVFSDRLLLVQFIAPLLAGLGLLAVLRAVPLRRLIVLAALLGAGTLLAQGIAWGFTRLGFVLMNLELAIAAPRWDHVPRFWRLYRYGMPNLYLLPLHLIAALALLLFWLRRRSDAAPRPAENNPQPQAAPALDRPAVLFVICVALLSPLCNVAAVFLRNFDDAPPRYLFACWLLPFLFLGLFVRLLPGEVGRRGGVWFRLAVVVFALYRIVPHAAALSYTSFELPYPPLAQTLDRLQRERGPMRGLAGYWVARRMDFLSRERVAVRPACWDGSPWFHAYNPNRYLSDNPTDLTLPRYNFLILSPDDNTAPLRDVVRIEFGEPAEKIAVDGHEVWLYERLSSPRFEGFLEAQLAQRICRQEKYVAPVSPVVLGQPKPNLTRWWSARNIQPRPGEEVEIRFDHPVHGGLIDVAANFCNEYDLAFYRGPELLGKLKVPAVLWTGSVFRYYPPPGMQSRLLRVPESLRHQSWDRVLIHPTGLASERSLGHFLIFEEDVARRAGYSSEPRAAR